MFDGRMPPGERIEQTHYGERQHETVSSDETVHYGDPQHDPEKLRPERVARLGYEDFYWKDDAQEASDRREVKDGGDKGYRDRYGERLAFEVPSEALILFG
jgi:hypothetical protein